MSHHARIEEVSDSDPDDMDPSDFDPAQFQNSLITPSNIPSRAPEPQLQPTFRSAAAQNTDKERSKNWQCLYPIYFDSNRTRAEGRRVGKELAVQNPLAREIVDACQALSLQVVFEPGKTHPKDWSNPGRVRIPIKKDGKQITRNVKNKHHLYNLVAAYLKMHPTTEESPMKLQIRGLPPPKEPNPPPAVPRGWKMNTILPLHSPAVTGGGVSDNLFKDMMAEMGGEGAGPSAVEGKKKKDKKKK